jgi:hypothetical protein
VPIATLIAQLGDDNPAVRESATRQLRERPEAASALRAALRSSDAEVARRADLILEELARRETQRALTRLRVLGKNGEADQVIERLVRRKPQEGDEAWWRVVTDLARTLVDLDEQKFKKTEVLQPKLPGIGNVLKRFAGGDIYRYLTFVEMPEVLVARRVTLRRSAKQPRGWMVRAEEVTIEAGGALGSLIVCSGRVQGSPTTVDDTVAGSSFIFAGDSVDLRGAVFGSVIVCDGDVTIEGMVSQTIIAARGLVRCRDTISHSVIVTAGTLEAPPRAKGLLTTCYIKEKDATPLGIRFFDPAQAGISVEANDGGMRVKESAADKPFARAGVRAGDVVVAIDSTAVPSFEVFRRQLRKHLAREGEFTLKLRRGDAVLEVRVPGEP